MIEIPSAEEVERRLEMRQCLEEMAKVMKCSVDQLPERVEKLIEETEALKEQRDEYLRQLGRL